MALDAILDTRFIFSFLAPESERVASWTRSTMLKVKTGKTRLGCSVISTVEFYSVTAHPLKREEAAVRLYSLEASGIRFLEVDREIAEIAGTIRRASPVVPIGDALIAATALSHARGRVLSDDPHFKRIKGIKVLWLTGP
jgi:predicted nucleic acid-binding protein